MKVLELFAGTRSIGKAFEEKGHEVFSVEWDKSFDNIDLYKDIGELTAKEILEKFGHPDVVWMSPDCSSFSISAISHHRRKNPVTGNLDPISDYAKFCDKVDQHCLELIKELKPTFYFIENPRGGMRKMTWMQDLPRYTACYCFSGDTKFITSKGYKTFLEMQDKSCSVLNKFGQWETGVVKCYGTEQLYKITLSRARKKFTIYATMNHLWYAALPTGTKHNYKLISTINLQKGMLLPYAVPIKPKEKIELIPEYVCRGFIFGDGYVLSKKLTEKANVMFCNEKSEMIPYFKGFYHRMWQADTKTCKIIRMNGLPRNWKTETPSIHQNSNSEIFSWLAGYFAADGSCSSGNGQVTISSAKIENLQLVRELANHIGIGTYQINSIMRKGYRDYKTPLYQLTFVRNDVNESFFLRKKHLLAYCENKNIAFQPLRYSVISVESTDRVEPVFCCETENTHTFTLENNIVTHNCRYGDIRMKPTDIWTNHPNPQFKMCHNGNPDHVAAPRGSKTGTQGLKNSRERDQ